MHSHAQHSSCHAWCTRTQEAQTGQHMLQAAASAALLPPAHLLDGGLQRQQPPRGLKLEEGLALQPTKDLALKEHSEACGGPGGRWQVEMSASRASGRLQAIEYEG